jgi:hypothetical protein
MKIRYRIVTIMQKPKRTLGQRLIESLEKKTNRIDLLAGEEVRCLFRPNLWKVCLF